MPDDPATLGYVAGLFDGDGHVGIGTTKGYKGQVNPSFSLYVKISNTDLELIGWLAEFIGGSIKTKKRTGKAAGWKQLYDWSLFGDNAEVFLRAVEPHLRVKRRACEVALRFRSLGDGRRGGKTPQDPGLVDARQACRDEILFLNRRGQAGSAFGVPFD
jgi:hypothetical protein